MAIKRRGFLKLAGVLGAGTVCRLYGGELRRLFGRAAGGGSHVLWLQGAPDSGCTAALSQGVPPDLARAIGDFRTAADFQPAFTGRPSDRALRTLSQAVAGRAPLDLLIVEGTAPARGVCTLYETFGRLVPLETWVRDLAAVARRVVAVGTCACSSVSPFVDPKRLLTVPGCPASPEQILLTLAAALSGPHLGPAVSAA